MATNLYETLGISRNATTEEVRRAYKKKALQTHPDRLPQGASAAEKSASEDFFRKVNNAYEVLHDPQSRATYDQHGVWPPPAPPPQAPFANGPYQPFSDPLFRGPRMDPFVGGFAFGSRPGPRGFTDPFVLFNSIFGDLHRAFEADPFFDDPFGHSGFGSNHSSSRFNNAFPNAFPSMLPSPVDFMGGGMGGSRMQSFSNGGNGGRWISQSWSSSTVNGVTHTQSVRRDSQGNEHVTYRFPDGTERRTINGIEQSSSQPQRAILPPAPPVPPVSEPSQIDVLSPPPYYEAVAQAPSRSRSSRHHGHYYDHSGDRREDRDRHRHKYGREGDRSREYDIGRGEHGYRDDRYGHDAQNGASWKSWRP
ncbi:DnaJ-domain-containing protein [Imleria badia]|nr:DnaJ-domain-containing protein [Imleria badia]